MKGFALTTEVRRNWDPTQIFTVISPAPPLSYLASQSNEVQLNSVSSSKICFSSIYTSVGS